MPGLRCSCCGEWLVPYGGEDTCQCGGRCSYCRLCPDDGHAENCPYNLSDDEPAF